MRLLPAALAVALLGLAPSAEARMHAPYRGHRIVPAASAPLDGFTQPSAAYSFRQLRSAYTGPAVRLRRASDNAELDINFLGYVPGTGAPWDVAAATAHCNATSCFIRTWYDQSGAGIDLNQTGAGSQLALTLNCWGSLPCVSSTANTQSIATATQTPVSPVTFGAVAERTAGTGTCILRQVAANNLQSTSAVANQWNITGTGNIAATAADAARHAFVGLINGAASVLRVDAAETTGTVTAITTANLWQIVGAAAGTTCKFGEWIVWNGYAVPAPERALLQANQKSFWGTP